MGPSRVEDDQADDEARQERRQRDDVLPEVPHRDVLVLPLRSGIRVSNVLSQVEPGHPSKEQQKAASSAVPRQKLWFGISPWRVFASFGLGLAAAGLVTAAHRTWNREPESPSARLGAYSKGSSPKAEAELERALAKAQGHFSAEHYSEALKEFTRASEILPGDPRPYDGLGNVYRNLVLEEKAEQAFRTALQCDPGYEPSKKNLCMLLYEFGKNQEAIALLREAAEKNPNDPFFWGELALNQIRLGKPAEAIPLLEKYNEANGKQAWGHANLARAHAEAGHAAEAEKGYRQALDIDPKMASAYLWLGQLLISAGRKAEAEPLLASYQKLRGLQTQEHNLKMALLRAPDHVPSLVELARVRYLLGKYREAVATFERAVQLAPNDGKLRHLYEEMVRSLEKANAREK